MCIYIYAIHGVSTYRILFRQYAGVCILRIWDTNYHGEQFYVRLNLLRIITSTAEPTIPACIPIIRVHFPAMPRSRPVAAHSAGRPMECDRTVAAQSNVPVEAQRGPPPNGTALRRHERQHSHWNRAHSHQRGHYNVSGGGGRIERG